MQSLETELVMIWECVMELLPWKGYLVAALVKSNAASKVVVECLLYLLYAKSL